jgi:hypothetical protein
VAREKKIVSKTHLENYRVWDPAADHFDRSKVRPYFKRSFEPSDKLDISEASFLRTAF